MIEEQLARVVKAQEAYYQEEDALWVLLEPLLVSVEACDEWIKRLPECSIRFRVWQLRKGLG